MRNEIQIFFTALMFYTRIPCPKWVNHSQEYLNKATRYFPLIGWIVALGVVTVLYTTQFILPTTIAVLLAMVTSIFITGAFHEDGFADMCDGFGGGWTKQKILDIMKDSQSGAYGVIGTVFLILIKFFILVELVELDLKNTIITLFLASVLSRFAAVYIMFTDEYVREDELSKSKPIAKKLSIQNFLMASIWVVPAFLLTGSFYFLLLLVPVFLVTTYLKSYFKRWIGGYTGDCLGAAQQINEVVILIVSYILWKFI
jgi:adenosylcobinamide-GDP ribazoletransferase